MKKMKATLAIAMASVLTIGLVGCGSSSAPAATEQTSAAAGTDTTASAEATTTASGSDLNIMLETPVESLDPQQATDGTSFEVIADYTDGLMQMDADGQHDECNIPKIYETLQTRDANGELPDIVLGSRFMEGSTDFPVSPAKKIAFAWFRTMLKLGTGRSISDPTTGLQGLSWRTFLFYSKYDNFDDKYPDANMLMQMLLLGFRVREIPAVMHMRTEGVSTHSGLKPILYMFRMTFSVLAVWIREKILKMDEGKIHALEKYDK